MSKVRTRTASRLPVLSVIIPAKNEARTIGRVIEEAKQITRRTEIIVVCNGCTDRTAEVAKRAGAEVIEFAEPLGHDVGRAAGARKAKGDILLFLDGDFAIPSRLLRAFYVSIKKGYDLALNGYSGHVSRTSMHPTSEAKRLLNRLLGQSRLKGSSLTAVPHAMSRRAAEAIGFENLAVPPIAQARAILLGMKISRPALVNVAKSNPVRTKKARRDVEHLILSDHAEAIAYLAGMRGERGGCTDFMRKRGVLAGQAAAASSPAEGRQPSEELREGRPAAEGTEQQKAEETHLEKPKKDSLSVIISARNEERTIGLLLKNVKKLRPLEIIVVENGSTDRTARIARKHGAVCLSFPEPLGHDVGRAIGARAAKGDILLFLDGDMVLDPEPMRRFVKACRRGADVALNDINPFLAQSRKIDYVCMAKRLLNKLLKMPGFKYASLTAVPHAIRRSAAEAIGPEALAVPPKAQAIAAVKGMRFQLVKGVDVLQKNRKRWYNRRKANRVGEMILGDHVEALRWLQAAYGDRIFFPDGVRRKDLIRG